MSKKIFITACILTMLVAIPGGTPPEPVTAQALGCTGAVCHYLPLIWGPIGEIYFPAIYNIIPIVEEALIIDHRHIDITQIPDEWLAEARELAFHYGHTSHGSQIISGLDYLDNIFPDPKYDVTTWSLGSWNSHLTDGYLPIDDGALNIYDGNYDPIGTDSYVEPGDYWEGSTGIARTTITAASGNFDYSMWSWCGQADSSESYISQYLNQMLAFETAFPDMRFILMTGHNVTNPGTNLLARNQQIRDYAIANNMVLFDFADIETHAPDGTFYDPVIWNYSDGDCYWCDDWCASHSSYCSSLPSYCSHVDQPYGGLICKMKGQAFWWMMARLAGWDGQ